MAKPKNQNWALLSRQALDGIADYYEYAKIQFPEEEELPDEEIRNVLTIYAHLLVCVKSLLLHTDNQFRSQVESDLIGTTPIAPDKNYIS